MYNPGKKGDDKSVKQRILISSQEDCSMKKRNDKIDYHVEDTFDQSTSSASSRVKNTFWASGYHTLF